MYVIIYRDIYVGAKGVYTAILDVYLYNYTYIDKAKGIY